jgi:hypothetical protein
MCGGGGSPPPVTPAPAPAPPEAAPLETSLTEARRQDSSAKYGTDDGSDGTRVQRNETRTGSVAAGTRVTGRSQGTRQSNTGSGLYM